jgi:hypothetical protein
VVGLLIGVYFLFLAILSNSVLNNALESLAFSSSCSGRWVGWLLPRIPIRYSSI